MSSVFTTVPQPPAKVGTTALRNDEDPNNSRAPRSDLDQSQRIATAGETVPIVFGKYDATSDIGGVWVSPAMIRQSCQYEFNDPTKNDGSFQTGTGKFLYGSVYPVSQGQLVGTPAVGQVYVGDVGLKTLNTAINPQVLKEYRDATYMAANPTYCPIPLTFVPCGSDNLSWVAGDVLENGFDIKSRGTSVDYFGFWRLTATTGSLNNTEITFSIQAIDAVTGAVLSSGTAFIIPQGNNWLVGGYNSPFNWPYLTYLGNSGSYIIRLGKASVNYQVVGSNPADTNTVTQVLIAGWQNTTGTSTPTPVDTRAYADITLIAIDGNVLDADFNQKQIYMYFDQGVTVDLYSGGLVSGSYATGASNQLVDLICYLFKIFADLQQTNADTLGSQIDVSNLQDIATFCSNYDMLCNGVISQPVNLIDYASQMARLFLLSFVSDGGQYKFKPLLPLSGNQFDTGALTPVATFTEDDILPGSFSKTFIPREERQTFFANMIFRETSSIAVSRQRSIQMGYPGTPLDAPIEQFDMTDVCASYAHAQTIGAYELARRKHTTHSVEFSIAISSAALLPTDIVKIQMNRVDSKGDNRLETEWYQVTNVVLTSDGVSKISAVHFPVDGSDQSVIIDDMLNIVWEVI